MPPARVRPAVGFSTPGPEENAVKRDFHQKIKDHRKHCKGNVGHTRLHVNLPTPI